MNAHELLDALGGVDEKHIRRAMEGGKKQPRRLGRLLAVACLCLAAVGIGAFLLLHSPGSSLPGPEQGGVINDGTGGPAAAATGPDRSGADREEAPEDGIFIPPIDLPEPGQADATVAMDMIGLVVYRGGIYTQAESYFGPEAETIDGLLGDCLGQASGTIDEWSDQEEYEVELASNIQGPIYAVQGYDTDFRIALRQEVLDENGEPQLWIEFLERLNGVHLSSGKDLFEDRLGLQGRVTAIRWQAHEDWNWNRGNLQEARLEPGLWEAFLAELDRGAFIDAWLPEGDFYPDRPGSSIYDTPNQAHLELTMEDGTTLDLRLIEGGYVRYDSGVGWYFVKMPGETFQTVYDACGGGHRTDW